MRTTVEATKDATTSTTLWHKAGKSGGFICIPLEVLDDRNLKHEALRVLLAIAKHADKTWECFPGRELLSEMTGIHPTNVSNATSKLAKQGWLTKIYGKRRSVTYRLSFPEKLKGQTPSKEQVDGVADLDAYLQAHGENGNT